jgi:hypothetical protein
MLVDIAYPSPRAGRWSAALALPRGRRRSLGASAALHSRACACALRRARTDGGAASIHAQVTVRRNVLACWSLPEYMGSARTCSPSYRQGGSHTLPTVYGCGGAFSRVEYLEDLNLVSTPTVARSE